MNNKKKLGQFFTTNYQYIMNNMEIPCYVKKIIEPFCGNGDMLEFIKNKNDYLIEKYDIDPKNKDIIYNDSLLNPKDYKDKFIITNPPYLARNKNKDKIYYEKYDTNDLYKCFIINLLENTCIGGIIIIPLNFLCSIRKNDINLRMNFLKIYKIKRVNIFEERVFDDTSYTICCILFENRNIVSNNDDLINIQIYPINKIIYVNLNEENNYTIGGEIYNIVKKNINPKITISRLLKNQIPNNNLLLKCIDDNSYNKINLKIVNDDEIYYDNTENKSARSYCSFIIEPSIDINKQKYLCHKFNELLENYRIKYHSLFLTNYRESSDISRKRISFELAFSLIKYILSNEDSI
jgi:hypothetical protein